MLLVDTREKRVINDIEVKERIATSRPHSEWLHKQVSPLWINSVGENDLPLRDTKSAVHIKGLPKYAIPAK